MALSTYGLLIGRIVGSRPQRGGHPHWLLMVAPSTTGHPAYRVAVNLQSTDPSGPPEVQYQAIEDAETNGRPGLQALIARLKAMGATSSFLVEPGLPALDFVHGDLVDPAAFQANDSGANPLKDAFEAALNEAVEADESAGAMIAVFGTGYPVNPSTQRSPSTGYTGVDNIHMNQGARNVTGQKSYFTENGPNQDGGLIFLLPSGVKAFFVKFQTQTLDTDKNGNPTTTGIPQIDTLTPQVKALVNADPAVQAAVTAPVTPPDNNSGFVFADPDPGQVTGHFAVDDDGGAFSTPFVMAYAQGHTRGPVPTPRRYPTMQLSDVLGANPPGYAAAGGGNGTIAFDIIGDSGAAKQAALKGETAVGDLISQFAGTSPSAFLFHVGDVVYYYGEKQYYYGQFADIFKDYPAPIFAIPGNHDGLVYNDTMVSLDAFQQAFCAATPGRWDGFGGILRSTMTQPGVFFTLDAPLVSIVGLYSNCGESTGWVDQQQLTFLHSELTRLKAAKTADGRAVLLAIHHIPRWFPGMSDPTSAALDAVCNDVGFWPDAVIVGHAHLYQRIVRQVNGRSIPYLVVGCGGYGIEPAQEEGKKYVATLTKALSAEYNEEGFVRATVARSGGQTKLTFDFRSTKSPTIVTDTCSVDLATGALVS